MRGCVVNVKRYLVIRNNMVLPDYKYVFLNLAHNHMLDPNNYVKADFIRIRDTGNQAYRDLVLTCTDGTNFKIINVAVLDELSDGDTALVFHYL